MGVDVNEVPDWVEGGEYPEDLSGWHKMTLKKFDMQPKEKRVWLKIEFSNGDGKRADLSQNLFTHPETDGEKKANQITFGRLKELWKAAGLGEADYPAPNPRAIANALNGFETILEVDVMCGTNDRGYVEAKRFRKVATA